MSLPEPLHSLSYHLFYLHILQHPLLNFFNKTKSCNSYILGKTTSSSTYCRVYVLKSFIGGVALDSYFYDWYIGGKYNFILL